MKAATINGKMPWANIFCCFFTCFFACFFERLRMKIKLWQQNSICHPAITQEAVTTNVCTKDIYCIAVATAIQYISLVHTFVVTASCVMAGWQILFCCHSFIFILRRSKKQAKKQVKKQQKMLAHGIFPFIVAAFISFHQPQFGISQHQ